MQWKKLDIPSHVRPSWLGEHDCCIPVKDKIEPRIELDDGVPSFNFDVNAVIHDLKEESYAGALSTPTLKFPFPYINLPSAIRLYGAKLLFLPKRFFRKKANPPWPVATGLDTLLHLTGDLPVKKWNDKKWGCCITHDVDTVKGLRCCLRIADEVEKAGFRSCFYIVGSAIREEPEIVRELFNRGHEIGSHDIEHDNRICFLPQNEMEVRIMKAKYTIEPYSGSGFRSPSLLRSAEMISMIGKHFAHDSSICDTDLEYYRGCTTVFPYNLRGCIEIPVTLPMDSSLIYTGYEPAEMLKLWKLKSEYIRSVGGLAMYVNHAEPHMSGGETYFQLFTRFLTWLKHQPDVTVILPHEAAERFALHKG